MLYMVCHGSHQYTPFMLAYIPAPWIRHGLSMVLQKKKRHSRLGCQHGDVRKHFWIDLKDFCIFIGQGANFKLKKSGLHSVWDNYNIYIYI